MEVRIERLVAGGAGLARTPEGVVLVRGGLPGERVAIGPVERRRGAGFAVALDVLEANPERIHPDCPLFAPEGGGCGGCDLRHASYALELEAKRGIVRDALRRLGGLDADIAEVAPSPRVDAYRNRVKLRAGRDGAIGLLAAASNRLIDVETCLLLRPEIAAAYADLRRRGTDADVVTIRSDGARALVREDRRGRRAPLPPPLEMPLAGRRFRTSWMSFFQVNFEAAEVLVGRVRAAAGAGDLLVDAYAGVGVFALALHDRFRRSVALEVSRHAVEDAAANGAGSAGFEVVRADADAGLPDLGGVPDAVVLDPPRRGLGAGLVRDLLRLRPPRLVYVSCAPPTFARDLGRFVAGGYRLAGPVEPIDLFPRTAHVEVIAALSAC